MSSRIRPSGHQQLVSPRVRWATPTVLEVAFTGHVDAAQVHRTVDEARRAVRDQPPTSFVIDATDASNYSTDVRGPGIELMQLLRDAGAIRGYAVAPSSAIRMIGTAVAFVAGIQVRFVSTLDEAMNEARQVA